MKYLMTFEKGEGARWLGHLDLMRAFERALRRSRLPVSFSEGFNPRPKLAFATALGVGQTAAIEYATVELDTDEPPESVVSRLNASLPAGFRVFSAERVAKEGSRDLLNRYDRARWRLICDWPTQVQDVCVQQAVAELLGCAVVPVERIKGGKTRTVDLRPWLIGLEIENHDLQRLDLIMTATVGQEGGIRPVEIVNWLAKTLPGLRLRHAHRENLYISKDAACAT